MKQIPLTQGKFALVDDEDYEYLNQFKWHAHKHYHTFYAARHGANGCRNKIFMHRDLLKLHNKHIQADHKDHDGLNNQRNNLRLATQSQNNINRRKKNNVATSKFIGVHLFRITLKWKATISFNKNRIHLGYFENEKDAAIAYNKKATELYGEFANLNKVA